jgi:hypothetical protein
MPQILATLGEGTAADYQCGAAFCRPACWHHILEHQWVLELERQRSSDVLAIEAYGDSINGR